MNDTKFRGKVLNIYQDNNELDWVYGDLVRELKTGKAFILDLSHFDKNTKLKEVMIEVIPNTVGQFTGLKDKNRVEIYEGDIIKFDTLIIKDSDRIKTATIIYNTFETCFRAKTEYGDYIFYAGKYTEVIGKRYKNLELLK